MTKENCKETIERWERFMTDHAANMILKSIEILIETNVNNIDERIDKLEYKYNNLCDSFNEFHHIYEGRITNLESKIKSINGITDAVKRSISILQDNDGRKPYKCPLCYGSGENRNESLVYMYAKFPSCKTCEGKGIVWG